MCNMTTTRNLRTRTVTESTAAAVLAAALLLNVFVSPAPSLAADFPRAEISNGQITAKMYLPDAQNGYYCSTRFDWSGAVYSLTYKGHEYYGA
jgi:hypothetical protein